MQDADDLANGVEKTQRLGYLCCDEFSTRVNARVYTEWEPGEFFEKVGEFKGSILAIKIQECPFCGAKL